ncbi:Uncharacterised protein [Mycobacteroides abscessus subsp. massiliense]|nr:Uncharacterised protein [Mycobacteroides abscessus subsp. massiliense]
MRMELGKINRSRLERMLGPAGRHADEIETEGGL